MSVESLALGWADDDWRSSRSLVRRTQQLPPEVRPTVAVAPSMVVDDLGQELLLLPEGLPEVLDGKPLNLRRFLRVAEGLQGELPPLALEHADPAPSLKPALVPASPPGAPGHC